MTIINGRQVAPTIGGIREDHVARYRWAAEHMQKAWSIIDLGCGCGYGASILAGVPATDVTAIDAAKEAIDYAKEHYASDAVRFRVARAETARLRRADAICAFEIIEHVEDPLAVLKRLRDKGEVLFGSVPNEDVIPFSKARNPYHYRHFRPHEVVDLLHEAGWTDVVMGSQAGKRGKDAAVVEGSTDGWTLVFRAW